MPDHVHILMELGRRLTIGQVVGKWKTLTGKKLIGHGLSWQRDFFEHTLRPDDDQESCGFYIFMNPYKARLVGLNETWPWWKLDRPREFAFSAMMKEGGIPQSEWLAKSNEWRQTRGW